MTIEELKTMRILLESFNSGLQAEYPKDLAYDHWYAEEIADLTIKLESVLDSTNQLIGEMVK